MSTSPERSAEQATDQARRAAREASPWIEGLGRFGYAAKGVVYVIVGGLAAQAAAGAGGSTTDTRGALEWIVAAPFGRFLLGAVAVGLAGYAVWRVAQGVLDTEDKSSNPKGLLTRLSYGGVGVIYAGLALSAVRLAMGTANSEGGEGSSTQDWTAWLLAQPFGQGLVALAGAMVIGSGVIQLARAWTASFRDTLELADLGEPRATWATRVGRAGFAARGIAFGIIGGFLIVAALQSRPDQARGLGGALETLARQPFGPWLLGIVAIGLVAYGLFALVEARYRRMIVC